MIQYLTGEHAPWKVPLGAVGALEADVLPSVSAGAGTFPNLCPGGRNRCRSARTGFRDFGAPRLRPGLTGTDAAVPTQPFALSALFAGGDGQAVAWDETLDGLPFASSRHVSRVPVRRWTPPGQVSRSWRGAHGSTAMQVAGRSNEFRTQRNGLFQFSSASIAFKF